MLSSLVIHVSTAKERRKYIEDHLSNKNINFSLIVYGDKDQLEKDILDDFFSGDLKAKTPTTSCAYKHLLAYETLLKTENDYVLILEDDIYLHKKFNYYIEKITNEIKNTNLSQFMISLEDSDLRFIPRSKRKEGKYIYQTDQGTTTAAYLIDRIAAKNILEYAKKVKINLPIDLFHTTCFENNIFKMYKSQPFIASQKTFDGTTPSLISNNRVGLSRIISYKLQKIYKKILYHFR
ncbi:glycosyltransferase family 25 protein [Epilithonimonas sp.]|uniref:glycosyltransferase family 25 protein n=1 Tax=Epilithonimonas sp. TaxID=2894511 RepID=UPI002FDD0445